MTVDHGLRPESAHEAMAVAMHCATHHIEHRIVRWNDMKPKTGIQAAARSARYALLAEAARDLGGRLVLAGHTADDQAETIYMRRQRGEGLGLSGIAPLTLYERKVWFARPQLGRRRADLREELRQRGVGWIDDPSNDNDAFERVRVRRELSALSGHDFDRLIETGIQAAARRVELGRQAARLIDRHARRRGCENEFESISISSPRGRGQSAGASARFLSGGVRPARGAEPDRISLDTAFVDEDGDAAIHVLRILLAVVGGHVQLPDLQRSAALFRQLKDEERGRFSLARAVIARQKDEILLTRERRGKNFPMAAEPALRSPWRRLLSWFDTEPARAVDQLLGKMPPPALPWP